MPTNIGAYSKALAAVLVAVVLWANQRWGFALPVDIDTWTLIVGGLITAGVFLAPKNVVKSVAILLPLGFVALTLVACGSSGGPDLAQQAKTATLTYTAATKGAQIVLKADLFPPKTEDCIKAADQVAWSYQDQLNLTAQEWLKAGAPEKKAYENAFVNIDALFNAATMNLTNALSGKGVC